jgi:hypothetical protein
LDGAYQVLANPALQSSVVSGNAAFINYLNTGPSSHFENDATFGGLRIGEDIDDFVLEASGSIQIPASGPWTFGVNSDDGFELVLQRNGVRLSMSYPAPRGPGDTIQTFNIPEAGAWDARLVYYERAGWASVEMFAAQGAHADFDASFRLVGDSATGGLAVSSDPSDTTIMNTNVRSAMQDINSSLYVRIPFVATNPTAFDSLALRMRYDDGFVAYLNGVEVARANAPANLSWNSTAVTGRGQSEPLTYETFGLNNLLSALRVGLNVLAIQGLNVSAGDGDFLVQAELVATTIDRSAARYFSPPTPGGYNSTSYVGLLQDVQFSLARGFYTTPQSLTLSTSVVGTQIRYTSDGSEPTSTNGTVYTGPIGIAGTSVIRAAAFLNNYLPSRVSTSSYFFLDDVLRQSPDGAAPAGWPSAWGSNVVDYGMDPNIVNDPRFGGDAVKNALTAIPTISITTGLANLFDPSIGIYSNAYGDGKAWERPASVELINSDGSPGFQINAGLRVRGGYSRSPYNPKHAFRLFFRGEYDGELNFPLFGSEGASSFEKIDLRTDQNYSWSFGGDPRHTAVRDVFSRDTQRDMGDPYTRSRYYHLYIDGQYWGMYQTQERSEAAYAATYFGGDKDNYDVIKVEAGPYQIYATDGNLDAWNRLWNLAKTGFVSDADYWRVQGKNPDGSDNPSYEVLVDIDNLVDYMTVIFYGGNLDAPISAFLGNYAPNNFYAMRDRTGREGFKFFAHDSEHTLLDLNENRNGPFPAGENFEHFNPQWLHQQLMANPEYRLRFADRVQKFFFNDGALTPNSAIARFQARAAQVAPAIDAESARWGDSKVEPPFTPDTWAAAIADVVNNYLPYRTSIVLDQFRSNGLFPSLATAQFLIGGSASHGGRVLVGSSLRFTAATGLIYYTTDGSDPRLPGGALSPRAVLFNPSTSPSINLLATGTFTVRVRDGLEWSPLDQVTFQVNDPADATNLIITELHYGPLPPNTAVGELPLDKEDFEFVEMRNVGPREIDLSGVKFTRGVTFDFTGSPVRYLQPGDYVLVVKNVDAFRSRYGVVPTVAGSYGSSNFANGGERVTLVSALGANIFDFTYASASPWPTSPRGTGPSLVPIDPHADLNNAANWRASLEIGGSPGHAANTAPTLSIPGDTTIDEDTSTASLPVIVGDAESSLSSLILTASSDNLVLLPLTGILLGGTGANRTVLLTPAADRWGTAHVSITVNDGSGGIITKTFTLFVTAVNDAPRGLPDTLATDEDTPLVISAVDLLANDTDPDGDALSLTLVRLPAHGSITPLGNGQYSYSPNLNFFGTDTFTYRALDGTASSEEIEVTVTIRPVNDAPVLANIATQNGREGQLLSFLATATDVDTPSNELRFSLGAGAPVGMIIDPVTGVVTWTPPNGPLTLSFTLIVSDGGTPPGVHERTVNVVVANAAPVVNLGAGASIEAGSTFTRDASFNDPGADLWTATVDYGDGGGPGFLTLSAGKTFQLNHRYTTPGTYSVKVGIDDGFELGEAQFVVTVTQAVDRTGPLIQNLQTIIAKKKITSVILTFDEPIDLTRAIKLGNYRVVTAGRDKRFGTKDDKVVALKSAKLDATKKSLTLTTKQPQATTATYQLTVYGASNLLGLTDIKGNLLDGNRDGRPGGNYLATFGAKPKAAMVRK